MVGVVGRMSGGKTYYAVELILHALQTGHPVATNINLNCRAVSSFLLVPCVQWKRLYFQLVDNPSGFNQIQSSDYDNYPCGSPRGSVDYDARLAYIVLDEVSSIFDSMVHASDSNVQKVATWARHSRKRGQELILIMQFASELHKRLRVHIQEYIMCTNSGSWRLPLLGWRLPSFMRNISIRRRYLDDGETPIGNNEWVTFNKAVYECYNTAQIVVGSSVPLSPVSVVLDDSVRREHEFRILTNFTIVICLLLVFFYLVVLCLML